MSTAEHQSPNFGMVSRRGVRIIYTLFSFALALLYDFFIWEKEVGLGAALLVATAIIGFFIIVTATGVRVRAWATLFFIPPLAFAVFSVLYRNTYVGWMMPVVAVFFSGVGAILSTFQNPGRFPFAFSNVPLLRDLFLLFKRWGMLLRDLAPWKGLRSPEGRRVYKGIVVALPLLVVFGALFADADRVFLEWFKELIEVNLEDVWRIARTILLTLLIGGFFHAILSEDNTLKGEVRTPVRTDPIVVGVVLGLMNVLFALFNFIQFRYLFGGATALSIKGLTYAEYARAGFGHLVVVLVLAALMFMLVYRSFAHHGRIKTIDALQALFIAQVGVIAASALKRTDLYEREFGYTVLRLYVEWFIYFAFVVLLGTVISIAVRLPFKRYWYALLALGATAVTVVGAINVDAVIANENIARLKAGRSLDVAYLLRLSDKRSTGVIAPLVSLVDNEELRGRLSAFEAKAIAAFFENFRGEAKKYNSFFEYHYGVVRAHALITDEHIVSLTRIFKAYDAVGGATLVLGDIRKLYAPLCQKLDGIPTERIAALKCAAKTAYVPAGYWIAADVGSDRTGRVYVIREDVTKKPFYKIVATLTLAHTEPGSETALLRDGRIVELAHKRGEVIFYQVVRSGTDFELIDIKDRSF